MIHARTLIRSYRFTALVPFAAAGLVVGEPASSTAVAPASSARATIPPLNPCVPTDHGLPEVTSVSFSPTSVDVREGPAKVTVTVKVSDPGGPGAATGLASGQVAFADGGLFTNLRVIDDETMKIGRAHV